MCFSHSCLDSLFPQRDGKEWIVGGRVRDGWKDIAVEVGIKNQRKELVKTNCSPTEKLTNCHLKLRKCLRLVLYVKYSNVYFFKVR